MNIIACACIDPYDGMMVNGYVNIYTSCNYKNNQEAFNLQRCHNQCFASKRVYVRLFMERDFHTTSAMIYGIILSCVIALLAGYSKIVLSPLHVM